MATNEIFTISRASLGINGVCPILISAVSLTEQHEILSTSAILSRFPSGKVRLMQRAERLTTNSGELPHGSWTKMMADATSEWVTNEWLIQLAEEKDPIWNEYLRVKGPLTWIEQDEPELQILRIALRSDNYFLNDLANLANRLQQQKAKSALQQAVKLATSMRIHVF